MRTKAQVHCLVGHTNTVADVKTQAADPEVRLALPPQRKYIPLMCR